MEGKNTDSVSAFDALFTTNRIKMFKVIAKSLPPAQQRGFVVCIRLMELQYSIYLLNRTDIAYTTSAKTITADFLSGDSQGTLDLLDELIPYSTDSEKQQIINIKNMLAGISKMKEMMNVLDMLKELFPEGFGNNGDDSSNFDLFSMFSGISGSDLSSIFDLLKDNT